MEKRNEKNSETKRRIALLSINEQGFKAMLYRNENRNGYFIVMKRWNSEKQQEEVKSFNVWNDEIIRKFSGSNFSAYSNEQVALIKMLGLIEDLKQLYKNIKK